MPDGASVLLGEIDDPGHWSQWQVATGRLLLRTTSGVGDREGRIMGLEPLPGGVLTMARGASQAWLYNLRGNRRWLRLGPYGGAEVSSAATHADGRRLAIGTVDGAIRIYTSMAEELRAMPGAHRSAVAALAWSARGRQLVSAGADGRAAVWDGETGLPVAVLEGGEGAVRTVAFDPAGTFVLTGGDDGHARVWEAGSGKLLADLAGHAGAVPSASFSPDGRQILTASRDGTARLWPAVEPELARDPPALAARVNAEVPYHLEQSRIVPGRLAEENLAYDRGGRVLLSGVSREEESALRLSGEQLVAARGALAAGDPLGALAWLTQAREHRAGLARCAGFAHCRVRGHRRAPLGRGGTRRAHRYLGAKPRRTAAGHCQPRWDGGGVGCRHWPAAPAPRRVPGLGFPRRLFIGQPPAGSGRALRRGPGA